MQPTQSIIFCLDITKFDLFKKLSWHSLVFDNANLTEDMRGTIKGNIIPINTLVCTWSSCNSQWAFCQPEWVSDPPCSSQVYRHCQLCCTDRTCRSSHFCCSSEPASCYS